MTKVAQKPENSEKSAAAKKEDRELTKELDMSFPASDPPASTQPGSGITGPEVAPKKGSQP